MSAPNHLRCEYFENPIGLDARKPRLSWWLCDDRRGARQTAYQIQCASSPTLESDVWDSGKVASDQSIQVVYAGADLQSMQRVNWRVRVWDQDGEVSPWSEPAFWEMGLLDRSEWKGAWIGSPDQGGPWTVPPTPYLRKEFSVGKAIAKARLYATGLGLFELELNGRRVSDDLFLPGRTEYFKRTQYHVFDVANHLKSGANCIGAILGDGWYSGHVHSDPRQYYGDRPRILGQLLIEYTDGSSDLIATDNSWKTTTNGPIRASDILMGEDYDARLDLPGWSVAGFDDKAWEAVTVFDDPKIEIVAKKQPTVRKTKEITPKFPPTISANKRRWIFDLGQNMVGHCRLKVRGAKPGKTIDLRHVEMLDKDGKPYVLALRGARATDHFTPRGEGEETFEPRFTFHGFRYVELRDMPGEPQPDTLLGVVVHSDTPPTGTFECSDPMINQLQSNIVWSQRGNFLEIPTDCPQRDERLGWTGDAQVFIRTAAWNMDVAGFFTKWLQDMADAQYPDGHIPSVVPHCPSIHHEGGPAWADAAVICPWTIYLCYGDTRLFDERYDMMARFVQWMIDTSPGFIRAGPENRWRGYGDWLSNNAETPNDLIGTAFFAHCAKMMSKIADALGKKEDVTKYQKLFEDVRSVFQKHYLTPYGSIVAQTQTANVLALHFDLAPQEMRPKIVEALVRDIKKRGMHLSTGFVGTPYLCEVLTKNGHLDVAYALLMQKNFPGWLFPITHGATTMWERWDGWTPEKGFNDAGMNSYNHYAYGAVGEWMYSTVAGIDLDETSPAYKHIVLKPSPGGGLTWAKASLDSMYGKIESSWKVDDGMLTLDVTIPPNTTATLRLPTTEASKVKADVKAASSDETGATYELPAGRYNFVAPCLKIEVAKGSPPAVLF